MAHREISWSSEANEWSRRGTFWPRAEGWVRQSLQTSPRSFLWFPVDHAIETVQLRLVEWLEDMNRERSFADVYHNIFSYRAATKDLFRYQWIGRFVFLTECQKIVKIESAIFIFSLLANSPKPKHYSFTVIKKQQKPKSLYQKSLNRHIVDIYFLNYLTSFWKMI